MTLAAASFIREARLRAGLSQTELGARSGVTQSVISTYEAGRRVPGFDMMTKLITAAGASITIEYATTQTKVVGIPDTMRGRKLLKHRREIIDVVAASGAGNVRVFGSVARGDDGPESDIDLLVDIPETFSLLDISGLTVNLTDLLSEKVDVIPSRGLKGETRDSAFNDAVPL